MEAAFYFQVKCVPCSFAACPELAQQCLHAGVSGLQELVWGPSLLPPKFLPLGCPEDTQRAELAYHVEEMPLQ